MARPLLERDGELTALDAPVAAAERGDGGVVLPSGQDAHWVDEATLDVLRHGRRVADLPAVVVMTYRDDEVGRDHPLRRVLGDRARRPGSAWVADRTNMGDVHPSPRTVSRANLVP